MYYGKPYGFLQVIKKNFETENNELLSDRNRVAHIYTMQPKRQYCKICRNRIANDNIKLSFDSHGIKCFLCNTCGHLNGEHEETDAFSNKIYEQEGYSAVYRV